MHLREFFYFQKSDRSVLFFILSLLVLGASLFFFFGGRETKTELTAADSARSVVDSIRQGRNYPYVAPRSYRTEDGRRAELFAFDPNTADSTQLLRLGLSPWQVRNIYKYRAKGGVYHSPEDFAKLYGLTRKQYYEMRPYIQISDDYAPAANFVEPRKQNMGNESPRQFERDTLRFPTKIQKGQYVNLANLDTTQLKKIPGIGSWWAHRIVQYGERLGGYTHVEQLLELDGFPVDALPYFKITNPKTSKLNINTLTLNQLRRHPYINFYQAREIVDYRRLKGKITDLSQLGLLRDFPPEEIERLRPYVTY